MAIKSLAKGQRISVGVSVVKGEPLRVMMYSHDGFGLGHLRRNTTIANLFVREVPESNVLMLVGCPLGAIFRLASGVDFIKIPSIIKVDTGVWHPRTLSISLEETVAIRTSTILKAAELFMPQLFLVDYLPTGVLGELLPTLQMLKGRQDPPQVILGLRDILDAPEVTRELWRRDGAYEAISRYYDEVFIYGCQDVYDTASQCGLDGVLAQKVMYCDYLCSGEACSGKAEVQKELKIRKEKLVVVTAGGGYDAYPMMRATIEAFQFLGKDFPVEAIIITGPLMEDDQRESLRRQGEGLPVRFLRFVENTLSYMNAADLVVTMASYNTLVDAVHLRKRILVIPREGPSAEQRMRAQVFSRLGLVQALSPGEFSPAVLAQAILENLDDAPPPSISLSMDGLTRVVRHMMRLLLASRCSPL